MKIKAKLRHLRVAPRKVRLVADLIRRKSVKEAEVLLNFCKKKAASPLLKLLKSALANAKNNLNIEESSLYISKITVDEGPKLKRWRARSRGRAFEIQKKTSHITLILETKGGVRKEESKKKKRIKKDEVSSVKPREIEEVKKRPEKLEKSEKLAKRQRLQKEIRKPSLPKTTPKIFRRKAF